MKNLNKIAILILALTVLSAGAFGQFVTLSITTLGAALVAPSTTSPATTVTLASTTGMLAPGPFNQVNTILYTDKEVMYVTAVVNSTTVTVTRGAGQGAGGVKRAHANGNLVYFANTQTNGSVVTPATSFIKMPQTNAEVTGTCTATNEMVLPLIYSFSGNIYNCLNGSSGGQWFLQASGTNGSAGTRAFAFCTSSLGSAETEYLNMAACSGATTATAAYIVSNYGTLANLEVQAGTAVTGGSAKDVLTVMQNGVATTVTCTFATGGAATTCSDLAHSVAVSPGDVIQFRFVTATSDGGANIRASVGIY
jgi:hypothetical protein